MHQKRKLSSEWIEQWQELRRLWREDAVLYAAQRLGLNPTWQQRKILEAISDPGAKVTVRSGHGIGKSGSTSAAIWWKMECFDYPKIPCTAPSASQLRDVLWAELSKWQRHADELAARNGLPRELYLSSLFKITQDRVSDVGSPDEWFAVARTARPENPDALQGFHASDVVISADGKSVVSSGNGGGQIMFVIEEASGVSDKIFEVAEGALSSHDATLLMVGNPTRNTGYFADSHKRNRSDFNALHFKSSESPLVSPDYRERLVRKFGEGSNVVRVRADGDFPKQDDDTLIALEDAEAALVREPVIDRSARRRLGVDVARFGDDRTVFTLRVGNVIERIKIAAKQSTMETAGMAKRYFDELRADEIYVDSIGVGAGVYDRLAELGLPVVSVNVAMAAPVKKQKLVSNRVANKHMNADAVPFRLRDYLWMELAKWVRDEEPSFALVDRDVAEDLAGEISSVRFRIDSSGRLIVESKDDMKKRHLRSPDIADSLMVTFADSARSTYTLANVA